LRSRSSYGSPDVSGGSDSLRARPLTTDVVPEALRPFLLDVLGAETVVGLDPSATSLEVASAKHATLRVESGCSRPRGS